MERTVATRHSNVAVASKRGGGPALSRRRFTLLAFWTSIAALGAAGVATVVNSLFPRGVSGFGGPVAVPVSAIPKPGDPPRQNTIGRFLLVNLAPNEGRLKGDETPTTGGLLALWTRCPHLGCTVPWAGDFVLPDDDRKGWFRCPCHSSTYTKAGVRQWGPATRSMDLMEIEVGDAGIVVQTGERTEGHPDNPRRAVPWPPAGA